MNFQCIMSINKVYYINKGETKRCSFPSTLMITLRKERDSFLANHKTSTTSIITPKITNGILSKFPNFWKRTSFCFPKNNRKGSVTIEAALVLPCFFFGVLCLIYLLEIISIQLNIRAGMEEASKLLSEDMSVVSYLSTNSIEETILECINEEKLNNSIVVDGSSGLDCSKSSVSLTSGIVELEVEYSVQLPVPTFTHLSLSFEEKLMFKGWTGYTEVGSIVSDDVVYITDNASVYHTDYDCTYLQLSISAIGIEAVDEARNIEGGTYDMCEKCGNSNTNSGVVYITESGESYHTTLGCSGLKRTIYAVPISEVIGKGACSRCG